MLFLDGVYAEDDYGKQRFHRVKAPTYDELNTLAHTPAIASLAAWHLARDAENTWLTLKRAKTICRPITWCHYVSQLAAVSAAAKFLHPANLAGVRIKPTQAVE